MTPSVLAVLTTALLAVLWLSGRRPSRPILRSCDTRAVAALNRAQLALAVERRTAGAGAGAALRQADATDRGPCSGRLAEQVRLVRQQPAWLAAAQRPALLRQLRAASRGGDLERLEAMTAAGLCSDRALLPLLRRGLRDSDPAVMRQAALAMEAFRGRPAGGAALVQPHSPVGPVPPPRNAAPRSVSRTR